MHRDDLTLTERMKHLLRLDRAVRLVWEGAPGWTAANFLLIMVQGLLPLAAIYMMKLVVDAVSAGISAADKGQAVNHILFLLVITALLALARSVSNSVSTVVRNAQAEKVTNHLYGIIHAKAAGVDLEYYENPLYHDSLHRAQNEAAFRPASIVDGLIDLVRSGVSIAAIAGLLLSFSWAIVVLVVVSAIPEVLLKARFGGIMFRWKVNKTQDERNAWSLHWLLTSYQNAKELRALQLGELFRTRFLSLRERLRLEKHRILTQRCYAELFTRTVATAAFYGAFAIIVRETILGNLTLGDMVMYYQAFQLAQDNFLGIMRTLAGLYEDTLFLSSLYEFLDIKKRLEEPSDPTPFPGAITSGIVFDGVSFKYPNSTRKALDEVNLTFPPGQVVALVGENGSGKTTVVKLLCRFYDPTDGKITVEGMELNRFRSDDLRRSISVVFQDYARYPMSARDNIWFGSIDAPPDEGRIESSAAKAGAHEAISGLARGYDTVLTTWFKEGEELSQGEWQKIAVSRFFYREARILVLDEPTSSLDFASARRLLSRIRDMSQGRPTILISHRPSTVQAADYIYVMEYGKTVEHGTHEELMKTGKAYGELFASESSLDRSPR